MKKNRSSGESPQVGPTGHVLNKTKCLFNLDTDNNLIKVVYTMNL
jgi:hypothetical protein